jgi:hypothetical protein
VCLGEGQRDTADRSDRKKEIEYVKRRDVKIERKTDISTSKVMQSRGPTADPN